MDPPLLHGQCTTICRLLWLQKFLNLFVWHKTELQCCSPTTLATVQVWQLPHGSCSGGSTELQPRAAIMRFFQQSFYDLQSGFCSNRSNCEMLHMYKQCCCLGFVCFFGLVPFWMKFAGYWNVCRPLTDFPFLIINVVSLY